ncbi:hypothetical protein GE061_009004 [Apolygus lucorum]|uniref:Uncharacterized protein n=1 Tax=Apolygus lucorum TaxID=248454 RepID=A0A8S9Y095_APOLU|nr:hypothetical protein GE061_009004 [Apolygus lucorum]
MLCKHGPSQALSELIMNHGSRARSMELIIKENFPRKEKFGSTEPASHKRKFHPVIVIIRLQIIKNASSSRRRIRPRTELF